MKLSKNQLEAVKESIAVYEFFHTGFEASKITIYANNTLYGLGEKPITMNQVRGVWASICKQRQRIENV